VEFFHLFQLQCRLDIWSDLVDQTEFWSDLEDKTERLSSLEKFMQIRTKTEVSSKFLHLIYFIKSPIVLLNRAKRLSPVPVFFLRLRLMTVNVRCYGLPTFNVTYSPPVSRRVDTVYIISHSK